MSRRRSPCRRSGAPSTYSRRPGSTPTSWWPASPAPGARPSQRWRNWGPVTSARPYQPPSKPPSSGRRSWVHKHGIHIDRLAVARPPAVLLGPHSHLRADVLDPEQRRNDRGAARGPRDHLRTVCRAVPPDPAHGGGGRRGAGFLAPGRLGCAPAHRTLHTVLGTI